MDRIDRFIKIAAAIKVPPDLEYDFSKLTSEELRELIKDDISENRMMEIVEPVRREVQHG